MANPIYPKKATIDMLHSHHTRYLITGFLILILTPYISFTQAERVDSTRFFYHRVISYQGADVAIDPNYIYMIEDMVDFMKENPSYHLHIRGHVCCGPQMRTSKKRAKVVYETFLSYGIDAERLSYEGYSDTQPAVFPEKTEQDAQANRRVDFLFCIP